MATENILSSSQPDDLQPAMSGGALFGLMLAVVAGSLGATVIMPALLPELTHSLLGDEPKAYWYLSRSSALVSFALLWASMIFGLLMTSKLSRAWPGGPTAFDLHQHTSLVALALALFHALILMGDAYIAYTPQVIFTPFASVDYKPTEVGYGQIALYALAIVALSFYVKGVITQRGWRLIHFVSFALYALALLHGLQSGTDSDKEVITLLYWVSGSSVLLMTMYRIVSKAVSGR